MKATGAAKQTSGSPAKARGKSRSSTPASPSRDDRSNASHGCACGGACPRCDRTRPLQRASVVSETGDALEREADRVADRVLRMPDPRAVDVAGDGRPRRVGETDVSSSIPASINRIARSTGAPLDPVTRGFFEPRFGLDLSAVRAHSDASAAKSAREMHARAYAVGSHIVFARGEYRSDTGAGRRLIAHELAHVMQQARAARSRVQRQDDGKPKEAAPTRDEMLHEILCGQNGTGLFPRTQVGDVFKLWATFTSRPTEEVGAMIGPIDENALESKWYKAGDWLGDEWVIDAIADGKVTVTDATCLTQETLVTGPLDSQPEHTVAVEETRWGPGTVQTYDNCQRVVFAPRDASQQPRDYRLQTQKVGGIEQKFYLPEGGGIFYSRDDLVGLLKVYLTDDKCGTPVAPETGRENEEGE